MNIDSKSIQHKVYISFEPNKQKQFRFKIVHETFTQNMQTYVFVLTSLCSHSFFFNPIPSAVSEGRNEICRLKEDKTMSKFFLDSIKQIKKLFLLRFYEIQKSAIWLFPGVGVIFPSGPFNLSTNTSTFGGYLQVSDKFRK